MLTIAKMLFQMGVAIGQLEDAAREVLPNKNLADILASAKAKIEQAANHPDASNERAQDALHDFLAMAAAHGQKPGEGDPSNPFNAGG